MLKARPLFLLAFVAAACAKNTTNTIIDKVPVPATLTVQSAGPGKVTSLPAGIDCGTVCVMQFVVGDTVSLTATPNEDSVFAGWSEPSCTGALCSVTLAKDTTVTATFKGRYAVNVSLGGTGKGAVTSEAVDVTCSATGCSGKVTDGQKVKLTAVADAGYIFYGWTGDCTGSDPACEIEVKRMSLAKAIFWAAPYLSRKPLTENGDNNVNLWVSGLGGQDTHAVSNFTGDDDFGDYDSDGISGSNDGTLFVGQISTNDPTSDYSNIWLVDAEKKTQHALTTFKSTYAWGAKISGDGKKVFFISNRDPSKQDETALPDDMDRESLWSVSPDGTGLTSIGAALGDVEIDWIAVSPDGTKLVVDGYVISGTDYGAETFWVINADGTGMKMVLQAKTNYSNWQPAWTVDGKALLFYSDRNLADPTMQNADYIPNLWRISVENGDQTAVTPFTIGARPRFASYSPDGQTIVFDARLDPTDPTKTVGPSSLWTVGADGKNLKCISGPTNSYENAATWAPGGSVLLFSQENEATSSWDVMKVDVAGAQAPSVVAASTEDDVTLRFDWD